MDPENAVVEDLIEEIPSVVSAADEESVSEFEFDDDFVHMHDSGVDKVVDILGGTLVNVDGHTISDVLTRIAENMEKQTLALENHSAIVEKQNKVLFRLSKVIENHFK
jgi:hypothetical protein